MIMMILMIIIILIIITIIIISSIIIVVLTTCDNYSYCANHAIQYYTIWWYIQVVHCIITYSVVVYYRI